MTLKSCRSTITETQPAGDDDMAEDNLDALKQEFEAWHKEAMGYIPERGVLCDYIEDEPLFSWIGWKRGYEFGLKAAIKKAGGV